MAIRTRIGDLVFLRHDGTDESEGVATNIYISDRLFDPGHVAVDAVVAGAAWLVMRVFFNSACVRAVRRTRSVAFKADDVCRF